VVICTQRPLQRRRHLGGLLEPGRCTAVMRVCDGLQEMR
jgi:hypothetical protein